MNELIRSYEAALEYPRNLVCHRLYPHVLDTYTLRLRERELDFFTDEDMAAVDFWEFDEDAQGFWHKHVHNTAELHEQLRVGILPQRPDPICRFM